MSQAINRFLISHGAGAFAAGVHVVLLAWIAVAEIQLSSGQWAWVQACVLIPNIALMLVAGAMADRLDPAKVLTAAQLLITLAYAGLSLLLFFAEVDFLSLLVYATLVGIGNAFVQPVREKLVTDIAYSSIQRRVSMLSITQFSMQSAGMGLAALSDSIGIAMVIALQAGVSLFSSVMYASLWHGRNGMEVPSGERMKTGTLRHIHSALTQVVQTAGLRQLMLLIAFNGYMHMGVFLVILPVVATQFYQLTATEYALLQLLFVLGMIAAHLALLHRNTIAYPGQGALFSLLYTALIGFGLAKQPTVFGFYCLIFCWGLVAGNSAGRCRLVLQSLAQPEMKGRLMAAYQLMLFGAAPIGALVTGYVMNHLSINTIFNFMSASSVVLFGIFVFTRTLWGVKQQELSD